MSERKSIMALLIAVIVGSVASAADFVGWWKAEIAGLPVTVHISHGHDGALNGWLYSPKQTVDSFALDRVEGRADTLFIECRAIAMRFSGELKGQAVSGMFSQGPARIPVRFEPSAPLVLTADRPQTPVAPFPYAVREVTVGSGASQLAGTLTLPRDPLGAVVFVTGSGSQDRDETIMGHKPFAVIADYLSRQGWATLRCDDRGVGGSARGDCPESYQSLTADVMAQIRFLEALPELKGERIGVLGHSMGGNIAFIAAADNPSDVDFVIALATPAVKGTEVMLRQNEMLVGDYFTSEMSASLRALLDLLASDRPSSEIESEVRQLAAKIVPASAVDAMVQVSLSPGYRELVSHDPQPYMERVKCPVLAVNGKHDMQVESAQNLPALVKAIPSACISEPADVNHIMQPCPEPTVVYSEQKMTVAPEVLETLGSFLKGLAAKPQ